MKKALLFLILFLCGFAANANPVGLEEARSLAQGFVRILRLHDRVPHLSWCIPNLLFTFSMSGILDL